MNNCYLILIAIFTSTYYVAHCNIMCVHCYSKIEDFQALQWHLDRIEENCHIKKCKFKLTAGRFAFNANLLNLKRKNYEPDEKHLLIK